MLSAAPYGGSGWCADTLGTGYRRPGLMPYLEFVVDDVLLRAHERMYLPTADGASGGVQASGQRWRLTARALRVMVAIIQNYAINRLPPPPAGLAAAAGDATLEQVAADFREEVGEYVVDGQAVPVRCARQKTVGFALMAMMQGRSRLLECVLLLLRDLQLPALEQRRRVEGVEAARRSVGILSTMQDPFKPVPAAGDAAGAFGAFGALSAGYGHDAGLEHDVEIDLSVMGLDEVTAAALTDGAYWAERVASNCLGLLYECALREGRFLEHLRAAPPLTLIRCEDGRPAHIPVMVQGFGGMAEVLSSSLALGIVAHFLCLPADKWHSLPPAPVLSARLLEHVASQQTPESFLWALRSTQEEDAFLMAGCVSAISEGDEGLTGAAALRQTVPLGADALPDLFTGSAATESVGPAAAASLVAGVRAQVRRDPRRRPAWVPPVSPPHPSSSMFVQVQAAHRGDPGSTTREAVLRLLLRTLALSGDRPGLAHQVRLWPAWTRRPATDPDAPTPPAARPPTHHPSTHSCWRCAPRPTRRMWSGPWRTSAGPSTTPRRCRPRTPRPDPPTACKPSWNESPPPGRAAASTAASCCYIRTSHAHASSSSTDCAPRPRPAPSPLPTFAGGPSASCPRRYVPSCPTPPAPTHPHDTPHRDGASDTWHPPPSPWAAPLPTSLPVSNPPSPFPKGARNVAAGTRRRPTARRGRRPRPRRAAGARRVGDRPRGGACAP